MTWIIFGAVFAAGGVLGVFVTMVVGIHAEERRMSLKREPETITSTSTRRVLAHVRRPDDDIAKFAI